MRFIAFTVSCLTASLSQVQLSHALVLENNDQLDQQRDEAEFAEIEVQQPTRPQDNWLEYAASTEADVHSNNVQYQASWKNHKRKGYVANGKYYFWTENEILDWIGSRPVGNGYSIISGQGKHSKGKLVETM